MRRADEIAQRARRAKAETRRRRKEPEVIERDERRVTRERERARLEAEREIARNQAERYARGSGRWSQSCARFCLIHSTTSARCSSSHSSTESFRRASRCSPRQEARVFHTPIPQRSPSKPAGVHRRDYLHALAQRVEVDAQELRIMGSKSELFRTLVAASSAKTAGFGVPGFVLCWCRKRDSNSQRPIRSHPASMG